MYKAIAVGWYGQPAHLASNYSKTIFDFYFLIFVFRGECTLYIVQHKQLSNAGGPFDHRAWLTFN